MTTVLQFWQNERDVYEQAQTTAQNDLTGAQLALTNAKTALAADLKTFTGLGDQIRTSRQQLDSTTVPSDVSALNLKIRDLIVQQRIAQGSVLDDHDAVDWAQADVDVATAALTRATAKLADAETQFAAARDANKQRQALRASLMLAPFDTLKDDANTLLGGDTKTHADATMQANFPTKLLAIAGLRYTRRTKHVTDRRAAIVLAETEVGTEANADAGKEGAAAKARIAFRQAERTLRDYAASAKPRYDKAAATLTMLELIKLNPNDSKYPDVLSVDEKKDLADAASKVTRETAEGEAEDVDTARGDVEAALLVFDAQILTAIKADVDTAPGDATVALKRKALKDAKQALKSKQTNFPHDDKASLDDWEAIVPDDAWQTVVNYFEALATLGELKDTVINPPADAHSLIKALDDAEQAYGTALLAAAKARRSADALADHVALRQQRYDDATTAFSARAVSAVRGDSF